MNLGGWERKVSVPSFRTHVVPLDDLREHTPDDCWCEPCDEEGFVVHNAADGREAFERGERSVS